MDVCCLNRPFDNQSQDKVRFEAEAVISILKRCGTDEGWELIGSDIVHLESSKSQDPIKRQKVLLLHSSATSRVKYNEMIKSRAAEFRKHNVKNFDSLHLASAEYANADVFLTTDAQLIKAAARSDAKIRIENPLNFYMEVLRDEQSSS
jgi:predicted nucleic acid-binding protein